MKAFHAIVPLLALCAAPFAEAQLPPAHVLETSVESNGANLHIPATASGSILVANCPACVDQSLPLQADTRYYINGGEVALAQLRSAALGRADAAITVHYRVSDHKVTRVDLTRP